MTFAVVALVRQKGALRYRPGRGWYKLVEMIPPPNTYPLLESIHVPEDLRRLPASKLTAVADELRQFLIQSVSTRGGHLPPDSARSS